MNVERVSILMKKVHLVRLSLAVIVMNLLLFIFLVLPQNSRISPTAIRVRINENPFSCKSEKHYHSKVQTGRTAAGGERSEDHLLEDPHSEEDRSYRYSSGSRESGSISADQER